MVYTNAFEAAVSCMETETISARNAVLLVEKQLGQGKAAKHVLV